MRACDIRYFGRSRLGFRHLPLFEDRDRTRPEGFSVRRLFEGRTKALWKLECHVSTVAPGAGLASHVDAHDVVIVVLEGEIETRGQRVGPDSVIFYPADESHGIRNPGDVVARYVVFEFHARRLGRLLAKVTDPRRWKHRLARAWRRGRP